MQWAELSRYQVLNEMEKSFRAEGLPEPPVPESLAAQVQIIGRWEWGTRMPEPSPYDLDYYAREIEGDVEPYLLVAQAGHGIQSVALHYYLVLPGVACLVQEPWGGAYTDDERTVRRLTRHFARVRELVDRFGDGFPQARRIMVHSGYGFSRLGTQNPMGVHWTATETPFEDALAL